MQHELFICYRNGDTNAADLEVDLGKRFYRGVAFRDVSSPDSGPLRERIHEKLRDCRAVLIVITRVWLERPPRNGESDYLTFELLKTLEQKKKFVPVYIGADVKDEFRRKFLDENGATKDGYPDFMERIYSELFVEISP